MPTISETASLLKEQMAAQLKNAIVEGRLRPGERVVERCGRGNSGWRKRPFARRSIY